ncbi:MAG: hypothetical protein IJV98_03255 [Clostridia bacterium]|nr:hypothetical protein [Clostridia bacterium]
MEQNGTIDYCPCMPACPNYGKCRECIAAHAAFYTVPHCVKRMQDKMKTEHIHPSNPHIKKTLPERVREYYASHENAHLRTAAQDLKITEWQLLDAMEGAISVPVSDFGAIYDELKTLDRVMLHLDTGSVVLQLVTPLPDSLDMRGMKIVKRETDDTALTTLLLAESFYAVFLVRETLCGGKESLSLAIVGEDEKIALSIYLRRTADDKVEPASKALFEKLWASYKNQFYLHQE